MGNMSHMSRLSHSGLTKVYLLLVCVAAFAGGASAAVAPATVRIHYNRTAATTLAGSFTLGMAR